MALVLLAGCGTRVLDLGRVDAGKPPFPGPFCVVDKNSTDGCQACFDEWGQPLSRSCPIPPPPAICTLQTIDATSPYCLVCAGKVASCLKCDTVVPGSCIQCGWLDGVGGTCRLCFDNSGSLLKEKDSCRTQRPELAP